MHDNNECKLSWQEQLRLINERITAHNNRLSIFITDPVAWRKQRGWVNREELEEQKRAEQQAKQRERALSYTMLDDELDALIDKTLAGCAVQIADYKAGKEKALMSIIGKVIKASAGTANPALTAILIKDKLV